MRGSDWAVALRSPEGTLVARVCPFDQAYWAFVDLCRECAGNRWLPRIELAAGLEGGGSVVFQLRAAAAAYVRFAIHDAALVELMFATKGAGQSAALREAFARGFAVVADLISQGQQAGQLPPGNPDRLLLLLIATLPGIASLVTSGRVQAGQTDALITDAVALFTHGRVAN
jgi:AcrR family transcriptional regulator